LLNPSYTCVYTNFVPPRLTDFMHTTDTHGWLEGHIKEQNYGADWGDFVSFTKRMKSRARKLGVDLLLVDTGVSVAIQALGTSRAAHVVKKWYAC
jgi:2',3'-cyclic-nucleotide 2'-phosphodiesterase (5'-nucleotidase family)